MGRRTNRKEWALSLVPEYHNPEKNAQIYDLLTNLLSIHGVSLRQMMDHDCRYPKSHRYFPQHFQNRVPSYSQFIRALDRMDDLNNNQPTDFQIRLARMEEQLLFNAQYDHMEDIASQPTYTDDDKVRFRMRNQMGSMLAKRKKLRGDTPTPTQTIINNHTAGRTFASIDNAQLLSVLNHLDTLQSSQPIIDVTPDQESAP